MAYGLIWPQEPVLFQVDDEYYQNLYSMNPEAYTGFFNSKLSPSPPFPCNPCYLPR